MGSADAGPCPFDGGANPAACPTSWQTALMRCFAAVNTCSTIGLQCSYPGVGNVMDGCVTTGVLECVQPGMWYCSQ
jgi:hypothetical protein